MEQLSCPYSENLEKAVASHSSTLAWEIPWTEEPGGLQSMESRRVGHDWVTSLSCFEEGNGNPLQCSCLEDPRDGGAWWAAIYGVAQSQTRLKWLSISSSIEKTLDFPGEGAVKNPLTMQETRGQSLDQEDHLQNEMVTHFSTILVWEIPGTEGPGKL